MKLRNKFFAERGAAKRFAPTALLACSLALAACGGGGGGSSSITPPGASPTPVPTVTPVPQAITGTIQDYISSAPLAGFTVTVGTLPNIATCNGAQTQALNVCGQPASVTATATTASDGTFTVTGVPVGTYMLTIAKDTTYATLHRKVTVAVGTTAIGTQKIIALSADEQAWLKDVNLQRVTYSFPQSFGNLVIDEFAEEQSRAEVDAIAAGTQPFGDATEALFGSYYSATPGALYQTSGVAAAGGTSGYLIADNAWFTEKGICVNGNWKTCVFASNTGHYMALSDTQAVWIGLGQSKIALRTSWFYASVIIQNFGSLGP